MDFLVTFREDDGTIGTKSTERIYSAPLEFAFLLEEFLSRTGRRDGTEMTYFCPQERALPIENAEKLVNPLLAAREIKFEPSFQAKKFIGDGTVIAADGRALDCDLPASPGHRIPPGTSDC